jgi:phenolphthiocerol/phthiocerol/phthiodiolone dimycocerosyl transferase
LANPDEAARAQPLPIRTLSPIESWHVARSMTMWMSVRVRGKLDCSALGGALRFLQDAFPVLRCRIRLSDRRFLLISEGEAERALVVREEALPEIPALWPLAEGKSLVAVDVVSDGDEHWVSFGLHHGVADGRLAAHYYYWFWTAYTQIAATGIAPIATPAPIPRAPEDLLRERGVVQLDLSGVERLDDVVWGGKARSNTAEFPVENNRRICLDQQTTAALRRTVRARGLSMHGAVCGAIVKAERSLVAAPEGEPVALGLKYVVDFRSRVDPPIGIAEGTNCYATAYARVVVNAASDPVDIGRRVVSDLNADLASGLVQQQIYHALPDLGRIRAPVLFVTNVGEFARFPLPDGLIVENVCGCMEVDDAPSEQVRWALGEQGVQLGWASGYEVSSYDGQLIIGARYPAGSFSIEEIDRLAATIDATLRGVANAEPNTS